MKQGVAIFLAVVAAASAQTVTLSPVADAFLTAANPSTNYGAAGALGVSASGTAKGEFDTVFRFNLALAKSSFDATYGVNGWALDTVTLKLTTTNPNNALFNNPNVTGQFLIRWMQNDGWQEGAGSPMTPETGGTGITFAGSGTGLSNFTGPADETLGTFTPSSLATGSVNIYTLVLTSGFRLDATSGQLVSLLALPLSAGISYMFNSDENTTPANRPVLTVTAMAVPEPTTGMLLATATGALLLRRRRKRDVA